MTSLWCIVIIVTGFLASRDSVAIDVQINGKPPLRMGAAFIYMREHQVSRACTVFAVPANIQAPFAVDHPTGDLALDEVLMASFVHEVRVFKRVHLDSLPLDDRGFRIATIDLQLPDAAGIELGCAAKSPDRQSFLRPPSIEVEEPRRL